MRDTGSNLGVRDAQEGTTALHLATFGGFHTAVQLLVAAGADIQATDNDGATPLVPLLKENRLLL
jgi:ankyrin repeat protein